MSVAKTRKRSPTPQGQSEDISGVPAVDVSGSFLGSLNTQSTQFNTFLTTHANDVYTRPWHRLERGLRLNRIRLFIASEKTKLNLSDADADYLTNLLHKSLDKKLLNSKSAVVYSVEAQEIQEIKGLIYHTTSEGRVLSQIVEKKGVTFRKPHH